MKSKKVLYLLIPVLTIIYSLTLRYSQGPFYNNAGYDPSYVYLISSLNIAQFKSPQHVDHPGTPLQTAGTVILKSIYFLKGSPDDISKNVFQNSEDYLKIILIVFLIFTAVVMFFCGNFLYKVTGNILPGILIQLSVFSSYTVSSELASVTPELFLIPLSLLLLTFSFSYAYSEKKKPGIYILIFSVICGIAIAVKLTFFTMLIIPLLLIKGVIRKMFFIFLTAFFFLVSILPAISKYEYFSDWLKNLILHDGMYGFGEKRVLNTSTFFENILSVFQTEIIFTISFVLMALMIPVIFRYRRNFTGIASFRFKLLISFFLTCAVQVIIVSKHFAFRYMIPELILCLPAIYLSAELFSNVFKSKFSGINRLKINIAVSTLIIFAVSLTAFHSINKYFYYTYQKNQLDHMNELIEKFPLEKFIVTSYGSSRKEYGLAFSLFYSGEMHEKYQALLNEMYPDMFYFDFFNNKIYSLKPDTYSNAFDRVKNILFINSFPLTNEKFKEDLKQNYDTEVLDFRTLYTTPSGETLYEVILK